MGSPWNRQQQSIIGSEIRSHEQSHRPDPTDNTGVEIDVDSGEYQAVAWYTSFSIFPPQAVFEAQHKISEILIKYIEELNRTKRQKQTFTMQLSDGGILKSRL